MNTSILDVYYVSSDIVGAHPSVAEVVRAWDDSFYIECNVKELAGAKRQINWTNDGTLYINGEMINGGLTMIQKMMLNSSK